MHHNHLFILSLLSCAALPGCVESPAADSTTTAAITGGTLVAADVAPYDAVFRISANGHFCTATKIGARRLLTAAHCVRDLGLAAGASVRAGHALDTSAGLPDVYVVDAAWQHPTYANHHQGFDRSRDVGVVDLTTNLAPDVASLGILANRVADGTVGTVVGYGCDDGAANHVRKKQRAATRAMPLAEVLDFPDWTDTYGTRIYTANVLHDNADPGASCDGDSGGPVLYVEDGAVRVGAVTRGHDDARSWRARLSGLMRWIASPGQDDFRDISRGMLLNADSDLCLGVPGGSSAEDVQLGQYVCDGRSGLVDNQNWQLDLIKDGYYQLRNGKSAKCVGVAGGSTADGARIAQYDCDVLTTTDKNQAWRFVASDTTFRLVNGKSAKCLTIKGGSTATDARADLEPCGAVGQTWSFVR